MEQIMTSTQKPRILFYDIETFPLGVDVFRLGKQVLRPNQLQRGRDRYDIISIQYLWGHEKKPHNLMWVGTEPSSEGIVKAFDEQVVEADILIGKNSDSFDSKHINTLRMLHGLPPMPDWGLPKTRDDLQKQIRQHFYLPSYSLDYLCTMLFDSGKDSMEFQDWIDIRNYKEVCELEERDIQDIQEICRTLYKSSELEITKNGIAALKKMDKYGVKDVVDTAKAWKKVEPYIKPKLNMSTFLGHQDGNYLRCKNCGSEAIVKNGTDLRSATPLQKFHCNKCDTQAGVATILRDGKYGKIR